MSDVLWPLQMFRLYSSTASCCSCERTAKDSTCKATLCKSYNRLCSGDVHTCLTMCQYVTSYTIWPLCVSATSTFSLCHFLAPALPPFGTRTWQLGSKVTPMHHYRELSYFLYHREAAGWEYIWSGMTCNTTDWYDRVRNIQASSHDFHEMWWERSPLRCSHKIVSKRDRNGWSGTSDCL